MQDKTDSLCIVNDEIAEQRVQSMFVIEFQLSSMTT